MLVDQKYGMVVRHDSRQLRWWTWGGTRANAVLAGALFDVDPGLIDKVDRFDSRYLRLSNDATAACLRNGLAAAHDRFGADLGGVEPDLGDEALRQLKFAELLPPDLARDTLAMREADQPAAARPAARPIIEHAG
jgi:ATP-dependent helicase Lhr and Lhr-like helicase